MERYYPQSLGGCQNQVKAKIPRSFTSLPKSQQELLVNMMNETVEQKIAENEVEVQKIYMKLCCILLNRCFGFGEKRLYMFLGNWKSIYRWNGRFPDAKTQSEELDKEIRRIFRKSGYPEQFINSLENKEK